ncbi:MAG: dienelactone hydrolase [Proteobacteria bacterium]|nr:dienelactone hydrolase [Pseudomonadota bacterium]
MPDLSRPSRALAAALCLLGTAAPALAAPASTSTEAPPSRPGVDAPELARLGPEPVGVRTLTLVQSAQPDVLAIDAASGVIPRRDRTLVVDVWYPARPAAGAKPEVYHAALPSEPPNRPAEFDVPGIAVRGATPQRGAHALVIVSHGYSNATAALSWLTENLASKGYVVAAIRHEDPPITDRSRSAEVWVRRPLDIGFVARELGQRFAGEGLVDPARVALVGYSMGGYGVLTSAGAEIDPTSAFVAGIPGRLLDGYAHGASGRAEVAVPGLRAVVAIAPAGGGLGVFGAGGLGALTAPLLLIAGDCDRTVDYSTGARAFFEQARQAPRYLLTYRNGGHNLGLAPLPAAMRDRLWDLDWFEDPVWRKERIVAINLHFITAFLDRFVRDEQDRASYLDGLTTESAAGVWPPERVGAWDAVSPGTGGITVWKGFQRRHAEGLEWRHAPAEPAHR